MGGGRATDVDGFVVGRNERGTPSPAPAEAIEALPNHPEARHLHLGGARREVFDFR
jgi:hypothetical protein